MDDPSDALIVSAISYSAAQIAAEPAHAFSMSSNRHFAVTCQFETRANAFRNAAYQ